VSLVIQTGEVTLNVTPGPAVELREISGLSEGTEDPLNQQLKGRLQRRLGSDRKDAAKYKEKFLRTSRLKS
jgi:hypothetical protein